MQFIGYPTQAVNRYTVTLNDRQRNGLKPVIGIGPKPAIRPTMPIF